MATTTNKRKGLFFFPILNFNNLKKFILFIYLSLLLLLLFIEL